MRLESWIRTNARLFVDRLFCSSSPAIRRVGDEDTGWVIHTDPPPQVCYCAGVGNSMSFELELAKSTAKPILVFDPSPTGIATVAARDTQSSVLSRRHRGLDGYQRICATERSG